MIRTKRTKRYQIHKRVKQEYAVVDVVKNVTISVHPSKPAARLKLLALDASTNSREGREGDRG